MDLLALAKSIADRVKRSPSVPKYRLPFVSSIFTATWFSNTA